MGVVMLMNMMIALLSNKYQQIEVKRLYYPTNIIPIRLGQKVSSNDHAHPNIKRLPGRMENGARLVVEFHKKKPRRKGAAKKVRDLKRFYLTNKEG
jgi:hypothetical protein